MVVPSFPFSSKMQKERQVLFIKKNKMKEREEEGPPLVVTQWDLRPEGPKGPTGLQAPSDHRAFRPYSPKGL